MTPGVFGESGVGFRSLAPTALAPMNTMLSLNSSGLTRRSSTSPCLYLLERSENSADRIGADLFDTVHVDEVVARLHRPEWCGRLMRDRTLLDARSGSFSSMNGAMPRTGKYLPWYSRSGLVRLSTPSLSGGNSTTAMPLEAVRERFDGKRKIVIFGCPALSGQEPVTFFTAYLLKNPAASADRVRYWPSGRHPRPPVDTMLW